MRKPTTTHFAVLGLLALRPWTTYELIQYMKRSNVRALWTKTEGRLYETPAELVELGFARATRERISRDPAAAGRERTRYSITRSGRTALRKWLSQPSQPPRMENEGLLKLAYGEQGTVEQFIAQIEAIQQQMATAAGFEHLLDAAAEPRLPSRHHISARIADLGDRVSWVVWEWLAELKAEVSSWETLEASPERLEEARRIYAEIHERAVRRLEGNPPAPESRAGTRRRR